MTNFHCLDCGVNTSAINEYYMVADRTWLQAVPGGSGMLCIGCLEQRLGRRLRRDDFIAAPINYGFFPRSRRMMNRINGGLNLN